MQVNEDKGIKLSEALAEIFLASLQTYAKEKGAIRVKSYQEVEDYLVDLFSDMMLKVYKVQEFNPQTFRQSLRKRKDLISRYLSFSS